MNKLFAAAMVSIFAVNVALAQTPAAAPAASGDTCEAKAISKAGKPLAGAAKAAFMKKCEKDSKPAEGKLATPEVAPPAKTTQKNKMKTCNQEATGKKGEERKKFMSECLKK